MLKTIKRIWRMFLKFLAGIVFLLALIPFGGFIQGLSYLLDGREFIDVGGVMFVSGIVAAVLVFAGLSIWPKKEKGETKKAKPSETVASTQHHQRNSSRVTKGLSRKDDPLLVALEKGDLYGDGVDADEIPGAIGKFGLDVNNPIPVKSVLGAIEYLESLTFPDGTKVHYKRLGSMSSTHIKHPVDAYELARKSGDVVCTIFLSPYHKRNSRRKPDFEALEPKQNRARLHSNSGELVKPDHDRQHKQDWEAERSGSPSLRFGRLRGAEIANFQRARDIVFKRDIATEQERESLLEAREELTRLYMDGYAEAFSVLGYMAVVHAGTADDISDGLKILRKCSDAGDWGSTCLLGDIYHLGLSVDHDYPKAWQYYTSAANQGSAAALTSKGIMAATGRGVPKDLELARELLTRAHRRGATTAEEWLDHLDQPSHEIITPSSTAPIAPRVTEIRSYIEQIGVPHLVHFTRCENLRSIFQHGLRSVTDCENMGIRNARNDDLRLDRRLDGISVSITFPNDKMFYKYRQQEDDVDWAVLLLSRNILWEKECGFFKFNAASSSMSNLPRAVSKSTSSLRGMFEIEPRPHWLRSYDPTNSQAEVMVFETIEPALIETVAFETERVAERWKHVLSGTDIISAGSGKGLFGSRERLRQT